MTTPPTPPPSGPPFGSQAAPQPGYQQVVVPPAAQPSGAYPPAPSQVYAPPAPPSSSNTVLKIVLIVVGVLFLFGLLMAAAFGWGAYKLSKAIHKSASGDVSISTPGGSISTGGASSITADDLGLPLYPGAKRGQGSLKMKSGNTAFITAIYTTDDSPEQVIAFYKSKMGDDASVMETNDRTTLTTGDHSDNHLAVTVSPQNGSTQIVIVHTTKSHTD